MPYIKPDRREELFGGDTPSDAGDFNFMLAELCSAYLVEHGLSYSSINDVVGALECQKMELYARIARPYEDQKIKANGDVYDDTLH